MNNLFEAAVEVLDQAQQEFRILNEPGGVDQCLSAICVLVAAEKVDERDLARVYTGFVSTELRGLLDAIKKAKEPK